MISIRTAVVVAGFAAMGLTSAAEYLAHTAFADPDPVVTVGTGQDLSGKVIRLTQKARSLAADIDLSPWI